MKTVSESTSAQLFQKKLAAYKQLIDADIAAYVKHLQQSTLQQYGATSRLAVDAFTSILQRGGKRIRGALVMLGYEMSGGTDKKMILQAARAIEMIHAYILIIDDIQDRSVIRRGGPTAHELLSEYHHRHQLTDDARHFGESLATNAALLGNHAALMILANLDVEPVLRSNVLSIVNRTMMVTAHGQISDMMNEVVAEVSEADVDRVLEWKTAHYTFLNPLHVGMVLAGADCAETDAITEYAMHAGRAFQLTDDMMGTFGTEFASGKSPLDDIREGKRTLLTVYAIEHSDHADKNFLIHMLGNHDLSQSEFKRCKDILVESGALQYAQDQAAQHVTKAVAALEHAPHKWQPESVAFLQGLAEYLLIRTS